MLLANIEALKYLSFICLFVVLSVKQKCVLKCYKLEICIRIRLMFGCTYLIFHIFGCPYPLPGENYRWRLDTCSYLPPQEGMLIKVVVFVIFHYAAIK